MTDNNINEINENKYDKDREKIGAVKANIQLVIVLGLIIAGIFISQILSGGEDRKIENQTKKDILVEVVKITPKTQTISFTKTGNIEVDGQINIIPQVSGRVVKISPNLNNGGVFEKDEVLFNIEQIDFINQINIAKAQVEQARTTLSIQQAESDAAIAEWKSLNPDKDAPNLVAKIPQLNQAKASLLGARAQLEEARLDYNRSKFSYNFAGRIIDTTIELGQFIQAGQNYGRAYPVDALEVLIPMTDRLLPYIQGEENESVKILTNYGGQQIELDGKINRIGSTLDPSTRFINIVVKPVGENWDKLIPGIFVDVKFMGKKLNNIWEVPIKSIQGQNKIWIVQDDQTLKSFDLDIISINDETALAIGNGNQVKIVSGLLKGASEGMAVRIKDNNDNQFPKIDSAAQAVNETAAD